MGTKGSYSGGGGAIGSAIRDELDEWLASLPGAANPSGDSNESPAAGATVPRTVRVLPSIKPTAVLATIGLFRSSKGGGGDGPGGGGGRVGGGGAQRSVATSAGVTGRGAAAALAYRTGDAETLRELGLDYAELLANPDLFDVANRIAQAVCEDLPPGTIEGEELLIVVGDLAGWVIEVGTPDAPPTPVEIAHEAIARVLASAYLVETASRFNEASLTRHERIEKENEIKAVCEEYAAQVKLSATGTTPQQFTAAVTEGLEALRTIYDSTAGES